MAPAAKILENPPIFPRAARTIPISTRAPPMAARPCSISPQDIDPNFLSASAISPRPETTIRIDPAAKILENPPIFPRAARTIPISTRAPPMAARPCPISSQERFDNCINGCAIICIALAIAIIATEFLRPTFEKLRSFIAPAISPSAPPTAVRPLAICSHERVDSC